MLRRVLLAAAFALACSPAFAASLLVIVDLQMQTMNVRVDGVTRYRWDVSTGRQGFETPPGRFRPIRMHKEYYSRQYDDAPMPYAIFFNGGIAIHGTRDLAHLGRAASHGCVRLDPANARLLFALVQKVGMLKTTIRVREQGTALAVLDAPAQDERVPDGMLSLMEVDETTTGSTGAATAVPWLRPGLKS